MNAVPTFTAACLLMSFISATAAEQPSTVRDRLWSWAVDASFDGPAHEVGKEPLK